MAANPYDQACRYLTRLEPGPFLGWLLRLPPGAYVFRRWLDTRLIRFPGEPERTCDTVAFLENTAAGGVPWAMVLEFQIEPDPLMFGRLLGYEGSLWLELKPSPERGDRFEIGAIVVNLTGRGNASRHMAWPEARLETRVVVVERNLSTEDAATVLAEIEAGVAPVVVLPLIPLMQGGADLGMIERWKERAGAEPDARRRADYAGLALVFAEAAGCREPWKEALKGWNMIQSQQVLEWQAEARVQTAAEAVLRVLDVRHGPLPEALPPRVRAIRDVAQLDGLLVIAVRCNSIDEFLAALPASP